MEDDEGQSLSTMVDSDDPIQAFTAFPRRVILQPPVILCVVVCFKTGSLYIVLTVLKLIV